jgi:hypothetical protein
MVIHTVHAVSMTLAEISRVSWRDAGYIEKARPTDSSELDTLFTLLAGMRLATVDPTIDSELYHIVQRLPRSTFRQKMLLFLRSPAQQQEPIELSLWQQPVPKASL